MSSPSVVLDRFVERPVERAVSTRLPRRIRRSSRPAPALHLVADRAPSTPLSRPVRSSPAGALLMSRLLPVIEAHRVWRDHGGPLPVSRIVIAGGGLEQARVAASTVATGLGVRAIDVPAEHFDRHRSLPDDAGFERPVYIAGPVDEQVGRQLASLRIARFLDRAESAETLVILQLDRLCRFVDLHRHRIDLVVELGSRDRGG